MREQREETGLFHGIDANGSVIHFPLQDGPGEGVNGELVLGPAAAQLTLVDHAAVVVAWYDGGREGGTAYTVKRARRSGVPVINLRPSEQLSLPGL